LENCFCGLPAAGTCGGWPIDPIALGRKQPLLLAASVEGKNWEAGEESIRGEEEKSLCRINRIGACFACLIRLPCAISTRFGADPLGNPAAISASGLRPMVLRTALSCRLPFSSGEIPMKVIGSITNRHSKERGVHIRFGIYASSVHIFTNSGHFFDLASICTGYPQTRTSDPDLRMAPGTRLSVFCHCHGQNLSGAITRMYYISLQKLNHLLAAMRPARY